MWTRYAWMSVEWGSLGLFGLLTLFWLIAYIPNKSLAQAFIVTQSIAMYVSWALAAWVIAAFSVGGVIIE